MSLKGKRYVSLLRYSSNVTEQSELISHFAARHEMESAGQILLFHSSDAPEELKVSEFIRWAAGRQSFEAVVVSDMSKFTRRGFIAAQEKKEGLKAAGVTLLYAEDRIEAGVSHE